MKAREYIRAWRSVEPSRDFVEETKRRIVGAPRHFGMLGFRIRESLGASLAGALALLLIIVGLRSFERRESIASSIAELATIEVEASTVGERIAITLDEVRYYAETAQKTSTALSEATANGPAHLSATVLQHEITNLALPETDRGKIDELLQKAAE